MPTFNIKVTTLSYVDWFHIVEAESEEEALNKVDEGDEESVGHFIGDTSEMSGDTAKLVKPGDFGFVHRQGHLTQQEKLQLQVHELTTDRDKLVSQLLTFEDLNAIMNRPTTIGIKSYSAFEGAMKKVAYQAQVESE